MKIATFNVNGVNGRLPVLMRWLAETAPDVACLQELKAADEKFPEPAIREPGYRAVWHGQKSWNGVAILARNRALMETRRGLPGDPGDAHSRYIEAAVDGILIGCLYLPNGNPAPGPKFDYKLRWFDRLASHAAELLATGTPVVLAGDFNVMPTELDVYKPENWVDDALFRPEVRQAFHGLLAQGWTDAVRALHLGERIYTFWDYFRNAWARNAGLRIDYLLLSPSIADRLVAANVDRQVRGWEKASDHAPTWIELGDAGGHRTQRRRRPTTGSGRTLTGAHHSLILNVIHDPSPYAAVVSAVSPVRSLEPGQTTAHRRHLTAAIFGKVGLSTEPKSGAALLCRCVGAAASGSDPANIYTDLARSLHYQVMPV